jgi:type VI secretion system protein ImpG
VFRDTFESEIDYLFQLCEELGTELPSLAPMLGRGADPAVTRLVEGLAFSFGRLRHRLDDDLPEVIHPIVENLCPELLRPLPSGTIVELVPAPKVMSRQVVPAGTAFASRPVDGVSCTFRSTVDCEVSPWALRRVDVAANDRRSIRLTIALLGGSELAAAAPAALRFFLALPLAVALEARAFLLRHVTEVIVRAPERDASVRLGPPVVPPVGRSASPVSTFPDGVLSPGATAFLGLRDYFAFPQSSAFLEFPRFDQVTALGSGVPQIEVELVVSEPLPKGIVLDTSSVLLHAVPAVNVFRPPKVSLPLMGDKRRCRVQLAGEHADAEVYAVERVSLVSRGLRSTPIEPWARFFPPRLDARGADDLRYEIHRTPSVLGPQLDVTLSFVSSKDLEPVLHDKVGAEVELLATNGAHAASVGIGDLCVATAKSPTTVAFRNVTPATRNGAPALAGDRLWSFFRFLKASLSSLTDTENLGAVIALANVPAMEQWPDAKPSADRFLPLHRVDRIRRRAPARDELRSGVTVRVAVDPRRFSGHGDLLLFGEALVPLLASSLRVDEWLELELHDPTRGLLAHYPRAQGTRRGL